MRQKPKMEIAKFTDYNSSITCLLDRLKFDKKIQNLNKIILKPNLLEDEPPPCTTDVRCIEAIISYILKRKKDLEIIIIEGSGGCNTWVAFNSLGYTSMAKKYGVKLVDVDKCNYLKLNNKNALAYKEIYLPTEIFDGFFISVPTLKDHSITTVTLGLKNLIGLLPKKYYGGYMSYNRSDVHRVGVNEAIVDLNTYVKVNMTIIDGRLGQKDTHTRWGKPFSPPKNIVIGGYDILEVDKAGAEVLGHKWDTIKHLTLFAERLNQ